MKYDFIVKPETLRLFIDDLGEEPFLNYKKTYISFKLTYNTEFEEGNPVRLLEVFEGYSDNQQMLLYGVKKDGTTDLLAYYYVGDQPEFEEEQEAYDEAIKTFKTILSDYKI